MCYDTVLWIYALLIYLLNLHGIPMNDGWVCVRACVRWGREYSWLRHTCVRTYYMRILLIRV